MPLHPDADFTPAWWLPGAHLQTLWGKLGRRPRPVPTRAERWRTPDGDEIELRRLDAAAPSGSTVPPRLLVLHGLEGTIRSHYLQGTLAQARRLGWAADILIFRGCNGVVPRARRLYHSGETSDLAFVVSRLAADHPDQPMLLAGFSLGGNVLLKWLGELGASVPSQVRAAVAVSVPFDLERGSRHIEHGFARVYTRHFLRTLRLKALAKLAQEPGLYEEAALRRAGTLFEFDDVVTAPLHGFANASDYYTRSSSLGFLSGIRRPTLLLSARDDPFLPPEVLDDVAMVTEGNRCLELEVTRHGGHVGFVGGSSPRNARYYAEERLVQFLAAHLADSTLATDRC